MVINVVSPAALPGSAACLPIRSWGGRRHPVLADVCHRRAFRILHICHVPGCLTKIGAVSGIFGFQAHPT